MAEITEQEFLVAAVETDAARLAGSLREASEAGVSEALLFPAIVGVFKEAGMVPDWLDMNSLMGLLG